MDAKILYCLLGQAVVALFYKATGAAKLNTPFASIIFIIVIVETGLGIDAFELRVISNNLYKWLSPDKNF
ncbi:MAG TPA: hypothetical protein VKR32_18810 [Puia sp.]|nr:hypothetical protein [Puia sp.]